jgi:hypothetical protein
MSKFENIKISYDLEQVLMMKARLLDEQSAILHSLEQVT